MATRARGDTSVRRAGTPPGRGIGCRAEPRPYHRELTDSATAILAMIAEGRSNAANAADLVVTKRAVERHINAIFLKLDLRDAGDVSRRVKAALVYLADQGSE